MNMLISRDNDKL